MNRKFKYIADKKIIKVKIKKLCKGFGEFKGECKSRASKSNKLGLCDRCCKIQAVTRNFDRAFHTETGRQRLAAAMANPIRRRLDIQSIARQAFSVQPLPIANLTNDIFNK